MVVCVCVFLFKCLRLLPFLYIYYIEEKNILIYICTKKCMFVLYAHFCCDSLFKIYTLSVSINIFSLIITKIIPINFYFILFFFLRKTTMIVPICYCDLNLYSIEFIDKSNELQIYFMILSIPTLKNKLDQTVIRNYYYY